MSDLRKAAEQALEALENDAMQRTFAGGIRITNAAIALRAALAQPEPFNPDWDRVKALEESLREHMAEIQRLKALAQPEQEPVAHRIFDGEGGYDFVDGEPNEFEVEWSARYGRKYEPLYTAPPQRKPLTDEEIQDLAKSMDESVKWPLCRAIEKAHGIE